MWLTDALALSAINFDARKGPYESMHSVVIEATKLILVGTGTTYQATGGAGDMLHIVRVCSTFGWGTGCVPIFQSYLAAYRRGSRIRGGNVDVTFWSTDLEILKRSNLYIYIIYINVSLLRN